MNEPNTPKKRRWGLWGGIGALAVVGIASLASASPGATTPPAVAPQEAAVQAAIQQQPIQQTVAPQTLSNDNHYTNVSGNTVHSPAYTSDGAAPSGATAQCGDGTYSFSQHHSGTCSHHGGVASWL